MSLPAHVPTHIGSDSNVIHIDPISEIERLHGLVESLIRDNRRLKRDQIRRRADRRKIMEQSERRGSFIRAVAQEYFSQNPDSIWFASKAAGRPVSKEEAIAHWREHGGPEGFARKFDTPEKVMEFFRLLHVKSKKQISLCHPILG